MKGHWRRAQETKTLPFVDVERLLCMMAEFRIKKTVGCVPVQAESSLKEAAVKMETINVLDVKLPCFNSLQLQGANAQCQMWIGPTVGSTVQLSCFGDSSSKTNLNFVKSNIANSDFFPRWIRFHHLWSILKRGLFPPPNGCSSF